MDSPLGLLVTATSCRQITLGVYMHRIALAALVAMSSIDTAQGATIIGFQPLSTASSVPVIYVESGYTIQSNNTSEPFPGVTRNNTLTLQKFLGNNGTGIPSINFARSTSFSLTGGTFTFNGLDVYFGSFNGISKSFTVVGSLFDKQLYSMNFTATGGAVQQNSSFRSFDFGSSTIFDKLVFTSDANLGGLILDDIRVSAATIPPVPPSTPGSPGSGGPTPDLVAAVPEPATWAMMILGFSLIGSAMRRRKKQVAVRFA